MNESSLGSINPPRGKKLKDKNELFSCPFIGPTIYSRGSRTMVLSYGSVGSSWHGTVKRESLLHRSLSSYDDEPGADNDVNIDFN